MRVIVNHSRFIRTIFFRLFALGRGSFCFFRIAHYESIVVVPQKMTEGAIFRQIVLYGYYVDSSGVYFAVYYVDSSGVYFAVCCTSQCRV